MKNWKSFNDECTRCGGSDVHVLTDVEEGYAYDGDDAANFSTMLQESDILKHGAELKAFKLDENDPEIKHQIEDCLKHQEQILELKKIDLETLNLQINI